MPDLISRHFDQHLSFDPQGDFEAFVRAAPPRWAVYLLSDEAQRPVQLLCVKNLRYSLKRRLGVDENAGPSRRVDYRALVRNVSWRRVDSAFEADAVYLEAARDCFPKTYQGMTGFRPAWFVHVNPETEFPRYTRTTNLAIQSGELFGPLEDRQSASKFIEDVTDWFDLCRYYHILVESPNAKACAYKEMGKCPAPCDGSISMDQYRRLIQISTRAIVEPAELLREQTARMQSAAKELRFETAAKIKTYIDSLSVLGKGPLRYVRRLRDFNYLALQHGPREGQAKAFLVGPGMIEEIAGVPFELTRATDLLRLALERSAERSSDGIDAIGVERVGIVSHHLFQPKANHGVFLPLDRIDESAVVKAFRELSRQPLTDEIEGEGVTKELQSM